MVTTEITKDWIPAKRLRDDEVGEVTFFGSPRHGRGEPQFVALCAVVSTSDQESEFSFILYQNRDRPIISELHSKKKNL